MKKNGFTLVELIAVLVILSIIALMATPNIISLMQSGKEKSFVTDVEEMVSTAKYMYKSESVRQANFTVDGTGYKILMSNLNGTVPDTDPYGYEYQKNESYIIITEPSDTQAADTVSKRTVAVHFKACKVKDGATVCHCLDSSDGDNLKTTDIRDCSYN